MKKIFIIFFTTIILLSFTCFSVFAESSVSESSVSESSEEVTIEHSFCEEAINYLNSHYVTETDVGTIPGKCPASFKGSNETLSEHCMFIVSYPDHYVIYFSIYLRIYELEYDPVSGIDAPVLNCELQGEVFAITYVEDRNIVDFSPVVIPIDVVDSTELLFYVDPESYTGIRDVNGDEPSLVFIPHSTPYEYFYCYNLIQIPLTYTPLPDDSFDTSFWEDVYSYNPDYDFSGDGYLYDEDAYDDAIDVGAAITAVDDNVFTAGLSFNFLFEELISLMGIESIIILLLVVGFSFYALGRF